MKKVELLFINTMLPPGSNRSDRQPALARRSVVGAHSAAARSLDVISLNLATPYILLRTST